MQQGELDVKQKKQAWKHTMFKQTKSVKTEKICH